MEKSISQLIVRLWAVQCVLTVFLSACVYWLDPLLAYSFALGGLNFWLANAYFALKVFRYRGEGEHAAQIMLQNIFRAEMNKFLLAAVGFAVIFSLVRPINALALFMGFIVMNISQLAIVSRWKSI